ncbi:hypothetical protein GNI_134430 [Gregarina niphandrodes]|uniref:Uncharacterized protein n=1 Tax=Gregarina niphandrodes TaxID=110365 RepID=A0A023B178_GRENI|nr:hypothetical protein GNI_134430 [Gregarina niphandrodes]EZG46268.1 hypothetical protein GNI_134430 [Gregarina niphandrodes]|eukprot:XP_011132338.1 hypothetical protein GNI_134430 [Gregarina niphandrodes]
MDLAEKGVSSQREQIIASPLASFLKTTRAALSKSIRIEFLRFEHPKARKKELHGEIVDSTTIPDAIETTKNCGESKLEVKLEYQRCIPKSAEEEGMFVGLFKNVVRLPRD